MAFQHGIYGIEYDEQQRSPLRKFWIWSAVALVLVLALIFTRGCFGKRGSAMPQDGQLGQTHYAVPEVETARERPSFWRHFIVYHRKAKERPADTAQEEPGERRSSGGRWVEAEGQAVAAAKENYSAEVKQLLERVSASEARDDLLTARKLLQQLLLRKESQETRQLFERKLGMVNMALILGDRAMPGKVRHKVVQGDLISKLARHYGCTQSYLLQVNRIDRPERMNIGQELWALDNPLFEVVSVPGADSVVLMLAAEFVKRYNLMGGAVVPEIAAGRYSAASFLTQLELRDSDRAELQLLLPNSAVAVIHE